MLNMTKTVYLVVVSWLYPVVVSVSSPLSEIIYSCVIVLTVFFTN